MATAPLARAVEALAAATVAAAMVDLLQPRALVAVPMVERMVVVQTQAIRTAAAIAPMEALAV
jgi:hypothetical protein